MAADPEVTGRKDAPIKATVVDIEMRFTSMVIFMVKWVLASIPALIILVLLASTAFTLFGISGAALLRLMDPRGSSAEKVNSDPPAIRDEASVIPADLTVRTVRVDQETRLAHRHQCPLMSGRIGYYYAISDAQEEGYRACDRCDPYDSAPNQYDSK
jgi:hypothetical protein